MRKLHYSKCLKGLESVFLHLQVPVHYGGHRPPLDLCMYLLTTLCIQSIKASQEKHCRYTAKIEDVLPS